MSQRDDKCRLVKDIYYEGTVRGLTTNNMKALTNEDGYRANLCKKIRENHLNKLDQYAPNYYFYIVGRGRLNKNQLNLMTWEEKLQQWEAGTVQSYPNDVDRFFYETSLSGPELVYEEEFIPDERLNKLKYSTKDFKSIIDKSKNEYVQAFKSKSGATLIIPIPSEDTEYTTIKEFIDTAPVEQQVAFWQKAVEVIRDKWKEGNVYVSTHGLAVPYFHLRIEDAPKYYVTERFKQ